VTRLRDELLRESVGVIGRDGPLGLTGQQGYDAPGGEA